MFNEGSSPTLRNCSFVANSVLVTSGSTSRGGSMYNGNGSSPQLTNCSFQGNSISGSNGSASYGGAISNFTNSSPLLINCNFVNNSVSGSANTYGGAIANNINSNPQLMNCSFITNSALSGTTTRGGAINNGNGCTPQLINCSFLNNSVSGASTNLGGAIANSNSSVQLTNCVLFNNSGNNTFFNVSNPTVASVTATYSLFDNAVTGYTDGPTNLTTTVSPFMSATDTRLNGCSPAINTGDNGANTTATDLDGNPRLANAGPGTPTVIDMGAYEYQGGLSVTTTAPSVSTAMVGVAFSQPFTASGGTSPYSFSLASGSLPPGLGLVSTGVLSGTLTQPGSFNLSVKATDATGCPGLSASYVLTVTDAVSTSPTLTGLNANPEAVCMESSVTFTARVGNVTDSYTYTLTNGLGTSRDGVSSNSLFSESVTASGTGPQTFTLTVRANNGQSATSVTALTVPPLPVASLTTSGPLSCTTTSVTLTAGGGNSYTFTNGSGTLGTPGPTNTLVVTSPGAYSVTVASASGCVSTTSTTLTSYTLAPALSVSPASATLTTANPTASLSATGTGTFRWSTGQTSPSISVTASGLYSVTLTDSHGCSASTTVPVQGADLTVTLELPQASFAASGTGMVGNLVVNVFEVGGWATSSGNVTITLTAPAGYTVSFPMAISTITVSGGGSTPVDNGQWTVTNKLVDRQITVMMNSGAFIGAGSASRLGFLVTRTSATSGSVANITVNVKDDYTMSYDSNLSNNVYARIITGL